MIDVCSKFPITEVEYRKLDEKFSKLCEFIAWQLIRKNSRNSHTDEQQDIAQELKISLIRAGSYYKRQIYIESCLELCDKYAVDRFTKMIVQELQYLWKNKTRHGAARQKFGPHQEMILDDLVLKLVPSKLRPLKSAHLKIDTKFSTYCKAITWNAQKTMGKKITREKDFRTGQVSLSEFEYLSNSSNSFSQMCKVPKSYSAICAAHLD